MPNSSAPNRTSNPTIRSPILAAFRSPRARSSTEYQLQELEPRPEYPEMSREYSYDERRHLGPAFRDESTDGWSNYASSSPGSPYAPKRRAMFHGPPPPIAGSVLESNQSRGSSDAGRSRGIVAASTAQLGSLLFQPSRQQSRIRPDSAWRAFNRRERAIEQDIQQLLDLQATGLVAGSGRLPDDEEDFSGTGSSTPTGALNSTAASKSRMLNSLHMPARSNKDGNVIPVRQPTGGKPLGLRSARAGLRKAMAALVELKREEDAHVDAALSERKKALILLSRLSVKRTGISSELHDLEEDDEEPLGKEIRDLGSKYESLTQEIRQLEEKLMAMRNQRKFVRERIEDAQNRLSNIRVRRSLYYPYYHYPSIHLKRERKLAQAANNCTLHTAPPTTLDFFLVFVPPTIITDPFFFLFIKQTAQINHRDQIYTRGSKRKKKKITMWPFSGCGDDACRPSSPASLTPAHAVAASPFALVLVAATLAAVRQGYPYLSRAAHDDARDGEDHLLPSHAPAALRCAHAEHGARSPRRRLVAWTFGVTVGLAATLGALILAEILDVGARPGRGLALRIVVPALLLLLVGVVPWLECKSLVNGAGWSLGRRRRAPSAAGGVGGSRLPKRAWLMQTVLFSCWLFAFWKLGSAVPSTAVEDWPRNGASGASSSPSSPSSAVLPSSNNNDDDEAPLQMLTRGCLERIGVVGISLMGLLAGFASVSAPWHTWTSVTDRRRRPVTDADVNRKQTGLDATSEMLVTKRHRLQMLERKAAADLPRSASAAAAAAAAEAKAATGLVGKMMGSLRGAAGGGLSAEEAEMRSLRVDIAGLETMEANLASSLALVRGRRAADSRAATAWGRMCLVPSSLFACYCVYRVAATTLTTLRRFRAPSASFSSSDPINRFLGLLALHWDPTLDQTAWARIISFVLSGVLLLASANSALQTFHLFARWTPGLLRHAQANLALVVGQVAATYMISASLLMRSQLPLEARSAVGGVLKGALSPVFVDGWFEGWFLTGSAVTALGLWLGRRLSGGRDEDWDDYGNEEMGAKRM